MHEDDLFEQWKARRRDADRVPEGFADRVMAEARHQQQRHIAARTLALAWVGSRWGKVTLCSVAFALYVYRIGQVVAVLLVH